jgi:hypothetical protein
MEMSRLNELFQQPWLIAFVSAALIGFGIFVYFFAYDDPTKLWDETGIESLSWTAKIWITRLHAAVFFGGALYVFIRSVRSIIRARRLGH